MRRPALTLCLLSLAGCGPQLQGELVAGRTVLITNAGDDPIRIERIIANDQTGRSECVDTPAVELAPGRSYTTTFFYCEEVREVDVETDAGWREVDFD
jgi:hypothetical protein